MNRYEYISDKKKYVKELIELMGLYKNIQEAIERHTVAMRQILVEKKIREELVVRFEKVIKDAFTDSVEGGEIHTMIMRHYEQALTQDQMMMLIEFYKDEKTKKITEIVSLLTSATLNMAKEYIERKEKEIGAEIEKIMAEERSRTTQYANPYTDYNGIR
jgi:hypothetical protein